MLESAAAADDPLLHGCDRLFMANLTHQQTVLEPPLQARVLGRSQHDPHQILRYGPRALSVQFDPEFDVALMGACLSRRREVFAAEGFDVPALLQALAPTPVARDLLRRFARDCQVPA